MAANYSANVLKEWLILGDVCSILIIHSELKHLLTLLLFFFFSAHAMFAQSGPLFS